MNARACKLLLICACLAVVGCGSTSSSSAPTAGSGGASHAASGTQTAAGGVGPEGMTLEQGPLLAPASSTAPGTTVDGIQCAPLEQLAYHIHARLQVYVNGQPRQIPGAIGMIGPVAQQTQYGPFYGAERCYYWLHTHTADGVIHIESPTQRVYTLGNFFDEWRQPLSGDQVASARGKLTAFVNGKLWTKDPRTIPLVPHAIVQLDVGSPAPPFNPVSWAATQL